MSTVAIMQPYVFPYLGYFQLIDSADTFVFYDDVNFIKKGWINRNRVLVNGSDYLLTVSVKDASQNRKICDTALASDVSWRTKWIETCERSYQKAPFFTEGMQLIHACFDELPASISELATRSITLTSHYLQLETTLLLSSNIHVGIGLERADRLIAITKHLGGDTYINPWGARHLYFDIASYFEEKKVNILFMKHELKNYQQFKHPFVAGLSILDVIFFNSIDQIKSTLLPGYLLLKDIRPYD